MIKIRFFSEGKDKMPTFKISKKQTKEFIKNPILDLQVKVQSFPTYQLSVLHAFACSIVFWEDELMVR